LGYRPLVDRYHHWKQRRALAQARGFIEHKDFENAKLALDVALTAVPGDPEALRAAADLLDSVGSPQVMPLRRRLVQIAPDSAEDRAALVMSALHFHDLNAARDALGGMTPQQAGEPAALKAALAYAMATNNKPMADLFFDRLQKLDPANQNLHVLHALLRAQSPRAEVADKARRELDALAREPRHSLYIHRELMLQAMLRHDGREAVRLARLVVADPRANLQDHLHLANLELNFDHRPVAAIVAELTPRAKASPADAAEFVRWVLVADAPGEALAWIDALPAPLQADPKIVATRADALAALQYWDRLENMLEAGAWGNLNKDVVQLAFAARIADQRKNDGLKREVWDEALASAGHSLADMNVLYRLASIWRWNDQVERSLWAIIKRFPNQSWAQQILFNVYRERKDTDDMKALMDTLRDGDPTLPRYKYDWALLSMLSFNSAGWTPPKQAMQDLYQAEPDNASYATGYAYALAQSDKEKEALAVLAKLKPADMDLPARAPYLAYIYGVCRQKDAFKKYAAVQSQLTNLLPEEYDLFSQGRDAVDRPVRDLPPSRATPAAVPDKPSGKA
jgi:hypothetical protein